MDSCSGILAELFLKGTILPVEEGAAPYDMHPGNLCRSMVLIFVSAWRAPFASGGNSGAGVPTIDASGSADVALGGMVVTMLGTAAT